jgi:hypothetical protein
VLHLLYRAGRRVARVEIDEALPGGDVAAVADRLRDVEGVLFLTSDPPGFSLSSPLRDELARALGTG